MSGNYASIGFRAFIISFLVIVGVGCVVGGITYSMELWGGHAIPDVVGMPQEEAEQALKDQGFSPEVEAVSSDEEKGTVLGTDPEAGVRAEEHTTVTVYVAKPKSVPNVVGIMIDEARAVLSENGYTNIEVVEKASNKEQGTVLAQDPKANAKAKSDDLVSLTVATPFIVPDVKGMSETEAKSTLANVGYKYYVTTDYSDEVEEGCAIGTVPAAGEACPSTTTIEIKVAKSRAKELEEAAKKYLESLSRISVNNRSFEISSVDGVTPEGDSSCRFTLTVRPFETHSWFGSEPETRYGNYEKIEGTLSINAKNEVTSSNPPITPLK